MVGSERGIGVDLLTLFFLSDDDELVSSKGASDPNFEVVLVEDEVTVLFARVEGTLYLF